MNERTVAQNSAPVEGTAPAPASPDLWAERAQSFKEREWALSEKLLLAIDRALEKLLDAQKDKLTLTDVARALEFASSIGRLSTGLPSEPDGFGPDQRAMRAEVDAMLDKIYGEKPEDPS